MFLCVEINNPSKFKLSMSTTKKILSVSLVKSYYLSQHGDDWPVSCDGYYKRVPSTNVYFFVFANVTGCSYTNSNIHEMLPNIVSKQDEFQLAETSAKTGATCFFDFQGKALVFNEDGSISFNEGLGVVDDRSEGERTRDAILAIQNWIGSTNRKVTVSGYTKNMRKFCPFTGGGDILLQGSDMSSILFLQRESEEDEEESGEALCSVIENKVKPYNDITLQLQANMLLASAESLYNRICKHEVTFNQLDQCTGITSYGVSFGLNIEFLILRSTINFECRDLSYECLVGPKYWLAAIKYVDAAIQFVVDETSKHNNV